MTIVPMTEDDARMISDWKYEGDYSFYNHSQENRDGLMDGTHFACLDAQGELIGYFCYGADARIPTMEENVYPEGYLDIGLGLRPDLCGKGLGLSFLQEGLRYAKERYQEDQYRLSVAAFNERAIKVYERAGFVKEQMVTNAYFRNSFHIMIYAP